MTKSRRTGYPQPQLKVRNYTKGYERQSGDLSYSSPVASGLNLISHVAGLGTWLHRGSTNHRLPKLIIDQTETEKETNGVMGSVACLLSRSMSMANTAW